MDEAAAASTASEAGRNSVEKNDDENFWGVVHTLDNGPVRSRGIVSMYTNPYTMNPH
jgi:hypothetical protein